MDKVIEEKLLKFVIVFKSGIGVDMYFGYVLEFYIYEYKNGDLRYLEKRDVEKYCNGKEVCEEEEDKFVKLFKIVLDCSGILCFRIGDELKKKLKNMGIEVFMICEIIEIVVEKVV